MMNKILLICMTAILLATTMDYSIYADENIDGFMGEKWGMNIGDPFSTFMGELYSDSGKIYDSIRIIIDTSNDVFYCPTNILKYGSVEIDYCNFIFKNNKLYAISISVDNHIRSILIFEELMFKYGIPDSQNDDNTFYWEDNYGSILFVDDTTNHSYMTIFSSIESTWDARLEFGEKLKKAEKEISKK